MQTSYWCSIPKRYQEADLETFIPHSQEQEKALHYLYKMSYAELSPHKEAKLKNNIIITGPCGTGKTHLGYAFLKKHADHIIENSPIQFYRSQNCFMTTLKDILDDIKQNIQNHQAITASSLLQKAYSAPILILDEVGVQYGSKMERVELFNLFNTRYNELRPTVILTNLTLKELYQLLGDRIMRRINEKSIIFQFTNQDIL